VAPTLLKPPARGRQRLHAFDHNYTVTPVPEPETYAMLLAGLGVMGAIARRRSRAAA